MACVALLRKSFSKKERDPTRMVSRTPDSAWSYLVCTCATLANAIFTSVVLSFGVMLPVLMKEFGENRERTALAGSLTFAITCFLCPVTGRLCDWLHFRLTHTIGGLTCTLSLLISSWATSNLFLYFSYSVLYGVGESMVFISEVLVVSKYFKKRRSLALGIFTAGAAAGVFGMAPLLQAMVDSIGWRNSFRVISGALVATCLLGFSFDSNIHDETDREMIHLGKGIITKDNYIRKWLATQFSVFTTWRFTVCALSVSLAAFGHFSPPFHLVRYCVELGISAQKASYLFLLIGVCSVISRILTGLICNLPFVNPIYINQLASLMSGLATVLLPLRFGYGLLVGLALVYGLADGMFMCTVSVVAASTVPPDQLTYAFGYVNCGMAFAIAAGPTITGLVADRFSYTNAFYMAGGVTLAGAAIPVLIVCLPKDRTYNVPFTKYSTTEMLVTERETVL